MPSPARDVAGLVDIGAEAQIVADLLRRPVEEALERVRPCRVSGDPSGVRDRTDLENVGAQVPHRAAARRDETVRVVRAVEVDADDIAVVVDAEPLRLYAAVHAEIFESAGCRPANRVERAVRHSGETGDLSLTVHRPSIHVLTAERSEILYAVGVQGLRGGGTDNPAEQRNRCDGGEHKSMNHPTLRGACGCTRRGKTCAARTEAAGGGPSGDGRGVRSDR